jgi:tetratricopeptide (TPR) repeat protein
VKRHLSFIVAFGVCFYALNTAVHGQQIKAEGEAPIEGDSSRRTIPAIPQEKVEELVRDTRRSRENLTTQQLENVALLGEKLNLNDRQVLAALDILADADIPAELLVVKLVEIAERLKVLRRTLSALPSNAEVREAIDAGELAKADALIADVETEQGHILDRATTGATRGEIALARLRYVEAATHFAKAASVFPHGSTYEDKRLLYLTRQATVLYQQGEEFGDNGALRWAIELYKGILDLSSRERVPLRWAAIQNNLGNALRILGGRESGPASLEEAVAAYREALKELDRERVPLDWAITQTNLGSALLALAGRESGTAKLEEAVAAYRAALKEQTRERVPLDWAMTQNNLGIALRVLGEGESGTAKLEEAVAAYREALKELNRERAPFDWATTQNNLGSALLVIGERASEMAKFEEAVTAYREALKELTRKRVPLQWATIQNNLGVALRTLGDQESETAKLEESVVAYREALKEWTRARVPLQWATTQINLGSALLVLGQGETGTATLEEAVAAYREALRELTYERVPSLWAIAVGNEGVALMHLARRRADVAMAEDALNLIGTAFETMRDGAEPSAAAYYERQLASARAAVVRLRGR